MGRVLIEAALNPCEQIRAGLEPVDLVQGFGETLLESHGAPSSREAIAASPRRQWVFTEFGEMSRVVAISPSLNSR
jgi:hypothetical protein